MAGKSTDHMQSSENRYTDIQYCISEPLYMKLEIWINLASPNFHATTRVTTALVLTLYRSAGKPR